MDAFESHTPGLTSPAASGSEITPNDATLLTQVSRCLYVGSAGNIRVELSSGDIVTLENVVAGAIYPLRVSRVFATGTTATGLISLA